jgi:hypothetical protein
MIKAAIDRILELRNPQKIDVNSETWVTQGYTKATPSAPRAIDLCSLNSLVDYLEDNVDELVYNDLTVHVVDYALVRVISKINAIHRRREEYIQSIYNSTSTYESYGNYVTLENFKIWLLTDFEDNEDRQAVLRLVGNVTDQQVQTASDDGISQAVSSRVGIAKVETAMVPNPVKLIPFRTFSEVQQPESNFVLRLKSGIRDDSLPYAALFEADGGAWKIQAMLNIKAWLKTKLSSDISVIG